MLKYIIFVGIMTSLVASQRRPTYAGTSNRYPVVLPQYLNEQKTTEPSLENRIDSSPSVHSTLPTVIMSANGDQNQIDWIQSWDQEKQPFWYRNWQQIQRHIGINT